MPALGPGYTMPRFVGARRHLVRRRGTSPCASGLDLPRHESRQRKSGGSGDPAGPHLRAQR
jgi:hypothetical protein